MPIVDRAIQAMTKRPTLPRCVGLFPSDGAECPRRESCLHYTEGSDDPKHRWLPRTEGQRCFDWETDLGVTVGRIAG